MTLGELLANPKPWLTTTEVADLQGVRADTVARWCRDGKVDHQRFGSTYRIPLRHVLEACGIDPAALVPAAQVTA